MRDSRTAFWLKFSYEYGIYYINEKENYYNPDSGICYPEQRDLRRFPL